MDVKKIVEDSLKKIYFEEGQVFVHSIHEGNICINFKIRGITYFDIEVNGKTLYVLTIKIEKQRRGKGEGSTLYKLLETIAKFLNCNRVQMTPSGVTYTGETRKSYLLRRGYKKIGNEVFKEII